MRHETFRDATSETGKQFAFESEPGKPYEVDLDLFEIEEPGMALHIIGDRWNEDLYYFETHGNLITPVLRDTPKVQPAILCEY